MTNLVSALGGLWREIEQDWPKLRVYEFDAHEPGDDQDGIRLSIGRGDTKQSTPEHLTLNWKTASPKIGLGNYLSSAAYVTDTTPECDSSVFEYTGIFTGTLTVVLEDFSVDTCLGFVFSYCRAAGCREFPVPWVDYANQWEQGITSSPGKVESYFGCLLTALGHARWESGKSTERKIGFLACLRLTVGLLIRAQAPRSIDGSVAAALPEYSEAVAHINHERQCYLQAIKHGDLIQLELPLRGSRRRILVDALIASEINPTGLMKVFIRQDMDNGWLKSGIAFMAVYRSRELGTGNDMVISVDPTLGLSLADLHTELERLEVGAWVSEGGRPADRPRQGYNCDEPWYMTRDETLVAAPRWVEQEGKTVPGSKLSWETIVSTLWRLYEPTRYLRFMPCLHWQEEIKWGEQALALVDCRTPIEGLPEATKLTIVKWDAHGESGSAPLTPTVLRMLAACAAGRQPSGIALTKLPPLEAFDTIKMPGGLAVTHADGVLLLDDWSREHLPLQPLIDEFKAVAQQRQVMNDALARIRSQLSHTDLTQPRLRLRLLEFIVENKLLLRRMLLDGMSNANEYHVKHFRQILEARWGLQGQLYSIADTLNELEAALRAESEGQQAKLIAWVTILGYPPFMFAGFFSFTLSKWAEQPDRLLPAGEVIHWGGLLAWLVISSAVMTGLWALWSRPNFLRGIWRRITTLVR